MESLAMGLEPGEVLFTFPSKALLSLPTDLVKMLKNQEEMWAGAACTVLAS